MRNFTDKYLSTILAAFTISFIFGFFELKSTLDIIRTKQENNVQIFQTHIVSSDKKYAEMKLLKERAIKYETTLDVFSSYLNNAQLEMLKKNNIFSLQTKGVK